MRELSLPTLKVGDDDLGILRPWFHGLSPSQNASNHRGLIYLQCLRLQRPPEGAVFLCLCRFDFICVF
jgi:hypothetical protein